MVYFYSKRGNFKPAMFYATFLFVKKLKEKNKFDLFISHRAQVESFIYQYDGAFDQINRNLRSSKRSAVVLCDILFDIIGDLNQNKSFEEILTRLQNQHNIVIESENANIENGKRSELKSSSFISTALPTVPKCSICGGAIHTNSISMDHIVRKREGGTDSLSNVQITHPYCNTGYKN